MLERAKKIVLTGGPGGGKTTAADLFCREMNGKVILVPEAATLLFSGGFPRSKKPEFLQATQASIFQVQKNLEDIHGFENAGKILLCDRGTVDGAIYWPGHEKDFFKEMGTSLEAELGRYSHVIYFESAAAGGFEITSNNPNRTESIQEAKLLDEQLRKVWSRHKNFHFVPHSASFIEKVYIGLEILKTVTSQN
jgi:predicted ATPase